MHRDPLQRLVSLIATEANPHHLILQVASDAALLKEAQRLARELPSVETAAYRRVGECCKPHKMLPDHFQERLQLIARILNLIPYEQNYYEILAVSPAASHEEIRQAFRRLSFSSHPDTNPNDPDAAERFRNLQHAYEVLSDDSLRQSYDRNLETRSRAEEETPAAGTAGLAWWSKWRRAWPVGALLAVLVLLSSVIDYRQWQADRFYDGMRAPHAPQAPPASSLRPTVPAPNTAQKQDTDREIRTFLARFAMAYEGKDPGALLSFFDADAIENGIPVENLMPVYEANFQRVEKMRYRIDVGRWEMGEDEVMVDGSFSLAVQFWKGAPVESTGPIHLTLVRRDGDFAVKRLTYSFKESRKIPE